MAAEQRGVKGFYLMVGGLVLLGGGLLWYLSRGGARVSIPANVTVTAADTAGFRGYLLGSPDAPVEITEYADYQCPACQAFETVQFPEVKARLIATGKLRWRYRDFPLDQAHPHARLAAHAAACADEQGQFWGMHEQLYAGQATWFPMREVTGVFRGYARTVGLDLTAYDACMTSARHAGRIQASLEEGARLGVNSTPTFLIGGRLYPGVQNSDELVRLVESLAPTAAPAAP